MENLENFASKTGKNPENLQNTARINAKKFISTDKKRYYCASCNVEISEGDHICGNCKKKLKKIE